MRKYLFLLLLCFAIIPVRAQVSETPRQSRNEFSVSVNPVTWIQGAGVSFGVLSSIGSSITHKNVYFNIPILIPVSIEYDYWLNDNLAVGMSLNSNAVSALPEMATGNLSVMPDIKFCWYESEIVRFYSKFAAGYSASFYCENVDGKLEFSSPKPDMSLAQFGQRLIDYPVDALLSFRVYPPFGIQFSPFCVDVNTALHNIDFFAEFGLGTLGICSFGFKTHF